MLESALNGEIASRYLRAAHLAVLVLAAALVFSNTLENDYHLDDIYRVKDNTEILRFWPPARFFIDVRTGSTIPQIAEYRPLMPLTHAIDSEIARAAGIDRLAVYHIGNLAIHIGSAILVYFLLGGLIAQFQPVIGSTSGRVHPSHAAFAAALIFAVHPISGSAVNYIGARDLLLMVFFLSASLFVYTNMRRSGDTLHGWLLALVLLSLAILSKQAAIVGFGWVFLYEWVLRRASLGDWRLWARTALFSLPTVCYFLLRAVWITKQNPGDGLRIPTGLDFPLTMAKAHVFYYLRNFFWPFEMRTLARYDLVESALEPAVVAGLVFIIATLVAAWLLRRRHPLLTFAILSYWLFFALEASIFPFGYAVTDYRHYLPYIFLCLIVGLLVYSIERRYAAVVLLAGMTIYFSLSSYAINRHWKTEESFWQQSVKYGGDALAHSNYAMEVSRRDPKLAEHHYLEALKQNPWLIYANINLGLLYISQKREEEGLALLQKMVELNPDWAMAHYWLSSGLGTMGRKAESLEALIRAADLDPRRIQYQYEAASALQDAGDKAASIPYLERIIAINPDYRLTGFLLGFAYQMTGEKERAIREYERFLAIHPDHVQTHFNLAYALKDTGRCPEAIEHFKAVLELRPSYTEAHLHLATCYRAIGNEAQAEKHRQMYEER